MADKKELEAVNPKWLLRRISETLPPSLPEELVNMIIALYAHSNCWISKESAERGTFEFSVTVPFSQLAKYTRLTDKGAKKRCERLRDDWQILSWNISANRNHGNDFSIRWQADEAMVSGEVLESQGGVAESLGGVLERSSGVPARTPSVLYGSSGLSGEAIANANVSNEGKELKTAGETPATSALDSNSSFESEFEVSVSGEPVSIHPASLPDFAALPVRETEPARWLANYLCCFLSVREDVEVLSGWEKFWTNDFQDALDSGWSVDELRLAIQMSQFGKSRDFYKRGASIVARLDRLVTYGRKLQERGLLVEVECQSCHGLFVGEDACEHFFDCYGNKPIDPEDAAEEEAMDFADELVSEGYIKEHPELEMYYPWADDDRHMFDPWAGEPEQVDRQFAASR